MLEDLGVQIVEVDNMSAAAVYVREVSILLIRAGASRSVLAKAADLVLLGRLPDPRPAPHPEMTP